jgi:hypothetical protein
MIGRDEKMLIVFEWIRTAAKSDISVLISVEALLCRSQGHLPGRNVAHAPALSRALRAAVHAVVLEGNVAAGTTTRRLVQAARSTDERAAVLRSSDCSERRCGLLRVTLRFA